MPVGPLGNAFTADEIRYVFEILENPYSAQYFTTDGLGLIGAETDISNGSTGQCQTQMLTWMTNMDATSITHAQALVADWLPLRKPVVRVNNGSVGENAVSGVTYDATEQRKRIQELMQIYIPFFRFWEVLAKRAGQQNSVSIPAMW